MEQKRTPQPTSSERHRAPTPVRHASVALARSLPIAKSRKRTATMSTFDLPAGELNSRMISSILNLVCPQCGGRMLQFQCEGRCRRSWLAEWEWAMQATRSSKKDRR
jgi:hypothetical protein